VITAGISVGCKDNDRGRMGGVMKIAFTVTPGETM